MLNLDYRDARPIYEQVRDNLRRLMVSGAIQEGKAPLCAVPGQQSCHQPNTISGPMSPGDGGYVYSIPGKGSFAAPRTGVDEERRDGCWGSSTV